MWLTTDKNVMMMEIESHFHQLSSDNHGTSINSSLVFCDSQGNNKEAISRYFLENVTAGNLIEQESTSIYIKNTFIA